MNGKGIKILVGTIVLLAVCNVALLLTLWLKPGRPPHGPAEVGPRNEVISQLKLNDAQVKQYDVLIQAHQQAMGKLRHDAEGYRQQFFDHIKNDQPGDHFADSLAQLIGENQQQIEMVTYKHFAAVRALCTDAQKVEFDNVIGGIVRSMGEPGHRPHPPGPGGPPPDPEQPR